MSTDLLALRVVGESSAEGLELSSLTAIVHQALDVVQPGERVLASGDDDDREDKGERTRNDERAHDRDAGRRPDDGSG